MHVSGTKPPRRGTFVPARFKNAARGKRRTSKGGGPGRCARKGGKRRRRAERMDFTQRARYFIMYADTKRTCDGRSNAGREEARCKNAVGEKQYAPFRSDRCAFSFRCIQQTRFEIRAIREEKRKRSRIRRRRRRRRRSSKSRKGKTMRKKGDEEIAQGCAEDFVAACLRAFTLTSSDASNLFRGNGEWNIFEVPRRPLAGRYSLCISLLPTYVSLSRSYFARAARGCAFRVVPRKRRGRIKN